jgi:ADP-ribose pyrophosphatase YjhB (NUDIX family)
MKKRQAIKALVVLERPADRALLVSEDEDPAGQLFQRPLGGGVKYAEQAEDAIRREIREEIGQELAELEQLGVIENVFSWGTETVHEIDFVFRATFADPDAYQIEEQSIRDTDGVRVVWRPPVQQTPPFYPREVLELLASPGP